MFMYNPYYNHIAYIFPIVQIGNIVAANRLTGMNNSVQQNKEPVNKIVEMICVFLILARIPWEMGDALHWTGNNSKIHITTRFEGISSF